MYVSESPLDYFQKKKLVKVLPKSRMIFLGSISSKWCFDTFWKRHSVQKIQAIKGSESEDNPQAWLSLGRLLPTKNNGLPLQQRLESFLQRPKKAFKRGSLRAATWLFFVY